MLIEAGRRSARRSPTAATSNAGSNSTPTAAPFIPPTASWMRMLQIISEQTTSIPGSASETKGIA